MRRRWNSSIISPRRRYRVGSPVRLMATFVGCHASRNRSPETFGLPLNPLRSSRWARIESSTIMAGSSASKRESEPHSWVRQQNWQARLQASTVGVIWRQRWLSMP